MTHNEILDWLREEDPARLGALWRRADAVRREHVGDEVHLRGLVEFSNHCVRHCAYCGLRAPNRALRRYRMSADAILDCARQAVAFGYGTVVLQSGEDYGTATDWLAGVIRRIKADTPLAVTLSLGERPDADLAAWREAGADRYLLRFETSDRALYERIHPPHAGRRSDRAALLLRLRDLGYEHGGGVMIGLPGQTFETLADDIGLFRELDLDMIGVGPYIPHPDTPLGQHAAELRAPDGQQAPATELMAYKVVALTRIVCPWTNLPATTAVATIDGADGYTLGLQRGANVVMPDLTPQPYRSLYEIYPSKANSLETSDVTHESIVRCVRAAGRSLGRGRGDSLNRLRREPVATT